MAAMTVMRTAAFLMMFRGPFVLGNKGHIYF